jgi:hypothetical protein
MSLLTFLIERGFSLQLLVPSEKIFCMKKIILFAIILVVQFEVLFLTETTLSGPMKVHDTAADFNAGM